MLAAPTGGGKSTDGMAILTIRFEANPTSLGTAIWKRLQSIRVQVRFRARGPPSNLAAKGPGDVLAFVCWAHRGLGLEGLGSYCSGINGLGLRDDGRLGKLFSCWLGQGFRNLEESLLGLWNELWGSRTSVVTRSG